MTWWQNLLLLGGFLMVGEGSLRMFRIALRHAALHEQRPLLRRLVTCVGGAILMIAVAQAGGAS